MDPVLVIDNGSGDIKAGFSDGSPKIVPNAIMKRKGDRRLITGPEIDNYKNFGSLLYKRPHQKGYLVDTDVQREVWTSLFGKNFLNVTPSNCHLVATEPMFNFAPVQESFHEVVFEEFGFQSLFLGTGPDFCAYKHRGQPTETGTKSKSCVVVDSGFAFTHIVPYYNCKRVEAGIRRIDIGGKALTNYLKELLSYRQLDLNDETYVVNQMKEDVCYVSQSYTEDLRVAKKKLKTKEDLTMDYVLPDFTNTYRGVLRPTQKADKSEQVVRLLNERFSVPELLFSPFDIGLPEMGISDCIINSVSACETKMQPSLYSNIVLSGGSSKFKNMIDRVNVEVRAGAPNFISSVVAQQSSDPELDAWHGGAAVAQTSNFQQLSVTKQTYDEVGHARCKEQHALAWEQLVEF
eukprot:m.82688 g.82688  ORF g.82688 m.82688 type:complete len:405 (+) comp12885_c0_seq1:195-1409(+)